MRAGGSSDNTKVVVAGGGIAGLEALLALADLAEDRVELTLVAPEPEFVYKPLLVEEPFDLGPAERHELAPLAKELGAKFVLNGLASVRPDDHTVELDDGSELSYDKLVVCVGGRFRPAFDIGTTFPSLEPLEIDAILDRAAAEFHGTDRLRRSPGRQLAAADLRGRADDRAPGGGAHLRRQLSVITPERSPLAVFGEIPSEAVAALLAGRKVAVETGSYAHEEDGELVLTPGERRLEASEIIALPLLEGPAIAGLPSDDGGFIPIDDHARVVGVDDVYAAGDGANFPIKQGGIGTQQADAAASTSPAAAGADLEPSRSTRSSAASC